MSGYFLHGSLLQLLLEHGDFSTDISQGSVATYLRCGRILKSEFIANLPLSANKKIENRLTFGGSYGQELCCCFFDSRCSFTYIRQIHVCVHSVNNRTLMLSLGQFRFSLFLRGCQGSEVIASLNPLAASISFNSWLRII